MLQHVLEVNLEDSGGAFYKFYGCIIIRWFIFAQIQCGKYAFMLFQQNCHMLKRLSFIHTQAE